MLVHPTATVCHTQPKDPALLASLRELLVFQRVLLSRSLLFLLWTFCLQHLTKPNVAWTEGSSHTSSVACLFLEAVPQRITVAILSQISRFLFVYFHTTGDSQPLGSIF